MSEQSQVTPTNAAAISGILTGFAGAILKQILADVERMGEVKLEKKVIANLHKGGHDLPAQPTDADRQGFVRHATRQFFRTLPVVGSAVADAGRDALAPRIAPAITPQLVAGVTTEQGVHLVGAALLAQINALAGI